MYSNKNKISRAYFLKTSGAALGGVVTLSHYACSRNMNSLKELIIRGKTNYNLVVPAHADAREKKAAQQLQFYLSKVSKALQVVNEEEYSGENAITGNGSPKPQLDSFVEDAYLFQRLDNNLIIAEEQKTAYSTEFTPYWNFF